MRTIRVYAALALRLEQRYFHLALCAAVRSFHSQLDSSTAWMARGSGMLLKIF